MSVAIYGGDSRPFNKTLLLVDLFLRRSSNVQTVRTIPMDTNKAAYWIALGVLALGLNSEYQQGHFPALHRVAGRAGSVLCRLSTRAEQTLAKARVLTIREGFQVDSLLASADRREMARDQAELLRDQARDAAEQVRDAVREQVRDQVRAQADVIRAQAEIRHAEIEQFRSHTRSEVRFARTVSRRVMVTCPKSGARVAVRFEPELTEVSAGGERTF